MNPFAKLIRWWKSRSLPRAAERIEPGALLVYTDKTKKRVTRINGADWHVVGIAVADAKKDERVELRRRGTFSVSMKDIHLPGDVFKAD